MCIDAFLAIAEELNLKGLTANDDKDYQESLKTEPKRTQKETGQFTKLPKVTKLKVFCRIRMMLMLIIINLHNEQQKQP